MKSFKTLTAFLLFPMALFSQTNNDAGADDGMNLFLLFFLLAAISIMVGATVAGSIAAIILLFLVFAFISIGILSISFLAGLYKRSLSAGFKTLIYIVGALCGAFLGTTGAWLVFRMFNVEISQIAAITTGLVAGFADGVLMSFAIIKTIPSATKYLQGKYLKRTN